MLRAAPRVPEVEVQRQASGREQHSQKITVYLSASELMDLERARLLLRSYGVAADRGRVVREAIAVLLADLDAEGERSLLAQRLRRDPLSGPLADWAEPQASASFAGAGRRPGRAHGSPSSDSVG